MGTVYAAWHVDLDRPVALKVVSPRHASEPRVVERFRREARMASQARHPNIVEVLDLGQLEGLWYIAMELLEGLDLYDAIVMKRCYEPAEIVPVLDQVLSGLEAAHGLGLVHRDLKPENVFLARAPGGHFTVKLLDFGVVKVPPDGEGAQAQLTRTGTVVGTPEYMAPEQATDAKVDQRADLYAIGCVAYAMLCGAPPFVDKSVLRVLTSHVCDPVVPPSRKRPGLAHAEAVDRFVLKALEKQPERRYQSAGEMRHALAEMAARLGSPADMQHISMPPDDPSRTLPDRGHSLADTTPAPMRPPAATTTPTVPAPAVTRPRGVSATGVILAALAGAIVAAAATWFIIKG